MSLVLDPRRLLYKTATIVALLIAGVVGKKCYDGAVIRKAELQKQIQVDSVYIRDQNKVIGELNGRVAQADSAADSLRAQAAQAKLVTRKVRADYDSLRADLDTMSVDDLNAALDSADAVIAAQDDQIAEQESAIDALVKARAVAAEREHAKDEKIAALDRINKSIAQSLPTKGTSLFGHLCDAAIGGALVWAATR